MSLTSYRAAPPRDNPLRAFKKTGPETNWAHAQGRRSIPSGGFLRRRPGQMPLGASGMYQRKAALQKPSLQIKPWNTKKGGTVADSFDFVVIGGGSGGCAVASRLSEDPGTSVALLEAGGADDNWVVTTPGAMILMISGKVNNWAFNTVPQAGLQGRIGYQPRGKGLGGSSAINAMVYISGHL